MRISATLAVVLALALAAAAHGQGAGIAPISPSKNNAARLRWMHYSMVAGRVVVSSAYQGTHMTLGPAQVERRTERLQIHIDPDRIHFRYELSGADEQLTIALGEDNELSIRRTRSQPKYALRFEQNSDGAVTLALADEDVNCTLEADSFWHLYLAEPQRVRRHLVPLLELLRPSWQLSAMGAAIEDSLIQRAQHPRPLAGERWSALVEDLASPKFADRENAQRELYKAGPVVVPFLQSLDRKGLDAEQTARVRSLIESLSVDYEDTTDRVATWLAGDQQVWLSLLSRSELFKRRTAADQLTQLAGAPVDFDPAADETLRAAQFERLAARLRKPKAEGPR
jgi:hypothetical protein